MALFDSRDLWPRLVEGLRPDPLLKVSEWADQHRMLDSRASSEAGPWRTDRVPYMREVMDSLSRDDPTQEVVVVAGAQLGKTESGLNWIGATVDGSPGPMLCVQPTVELAKRFSKQRLTPLIEGTSRLREKIKPSRARDSGNTVLSKEYQGGIVLLAGANSAAGLRSAPIRDGFFDEVDAYPLDVDGEGDPLELAVARTRNFSRRKVLYTSTPTLAGTSRIWAMWMLSDQRVYLVPCPHCGHEQRIEWERIRYDAKQLETDHADVRLACESCGVLIEERHKGRMLAAGRWEAQNPGARIRGYQISSLYSPLGWFSWADAARQWEKAQGNDLKLRVFHNTVLGLPWAEQGEAPEWEAIYRRREDYPIGTVPGGALVLTAGVDVQRSPGRLEVEVVAWGPGLESWSVDYRVLEGDTGTVDGDPWRELSKLLRETFPVEGGGRLPISRMAVDSGDQTQTVYAWVRAQRDQRVMATKGRDSQLQLVGLPTSQEVRVDGKRYRHGIKLWNIGVSTGKQELYGWLKQEVPLEPDAPLPPGWCHFPMYPQEWFMGLTAEELQMREVRGFPVWEWVKIRKRNEPLDCRVMARAALSSLGADRWSAEQWAARASKVTQRTVEKIEKATATAAPAAGGAVTAAVPKRERKGGGWLSGGAGGRRGGGSWL